VNRLLLSIGPVSLAGLFLMRGLFPSPDPLLLGIFVVLIGDIDLRLAVAGSAAGLALGAGLLLLFPVLSPQTGFGADLTSAELDELPVIELLNFRYEPPIVSIQASGVYRAKVDNPSDLPHTVTIDAIDLEVFAPLVVGRSSRSMVQNSPQGNSNSSARSVTTRRRACRHCSRSNEALALDVVLLDRHRAGGVCAGDGQRCRAAEW